MEELESRWQREAEAVLSGMQEWRLQHPRASLREIEAALDERLDRMRARLLQDLALASTAADLARQAGHERPRCARCDVPLEPRGRHARTVVAQGDQPLHLERSYGVCPSCNDGLFPPG
jgi:uncharacterized protein with PIN domain